jgi:hypothetical protein
VNLGEGDFGKPYSEAVGKFADQFITLTAANLMPLETLIMAVAPRVILEAGSELGLAVGAEFEVLREGPKLKRSDGTVVSPTMRVARLRIVRVDNGMSYADIVETYNDIEARDPAPDRSRVTEGMVARFVPVAAPPAKK